MAGLRNLEPSQPCQRQMTNRWWLKVVIIITSMRSRVIRVAWRGCQQNFTGASILLIRLSTHFHKYGDVCWERDGAQIEARRRVDAGTSARRSNKKMGPSRPNPSGGGGLRAISLSLVVVDVPASPPPLFATSPRKPHPQTLPYLGKGVLMATRQYLTFVLYILRMTPGIVYEEFVIFCKVQARNR